MYTSDSISALEKADHTPWYVGMFSQVATNYWSWARNDPRIIGINPWYWGDDRSDASSGGYNVSIRQQPNARAMWECIGREVMGGGGGACRANGPGEADGVGGDSGRGGGAWGGRAPGGAGGDRDSTEEEEEEEKDGKVAVAARTFTRTRRSAIPRTVVMKGTFEDERDTAI